MKIKVLSNRIRIKQSDIDYAIAYNKEHDLDITFDVSDVDVNGYKSVYSLVRPAQNWSQWILLGADKLVPKQDGYDIVIFAFDQNEWKAPAGGKYPLLPNTPSSSCIVVNNKPFINFGIYPTDPQLNITLIHELMHAYDYIVSLKGHNIVDQMDTYYHNDDPHFPTGNFAVQWNNLKPYMSILQTKPRLLTLTTPFMRGEDVKQVQIQLGIVADGIYGNDTKKAVIAFQKSHGLVADGIVGSGTLAKLYEKTTAPDLTKWKLVPQLETLAQQFLLLTKQKGYDLKITQGWRDPEYQNKLYAQGRTIAGNIVTNATGMDSKHCLGKAFDVAFNGATPYPANADWKAIGTIGKSLGLTWGGDFHSFVDQLHFEI